MPFFPKDYDQMVTEGLQRLRGESNITQLSPGSKTRFILDTITREQANQHALFNQNLLQAYVRWAEGRFLDFFGDIMHVPRWEATNATADADHMNFLFYVESGTFGGINNDLDFTIPAGTRVSTVDFNVQRTAQPGSFVSARDQQTKVTFVTTSDIVCSANRSFAWATVRATVEGKKSDVPRNALRVHDFSAYALSGRSLLKCRNKYAITNGRERESDESYRYRLMNAFKAKERANKIAIRLAALSVPGVADILEVNVEQGPGTYSVYIEGVSSTVSPGLISGVMSAVEGVSAFGIRPFVLAPLPVGLEFVIGLRWKDNTTETEKVVAQAEIRESIETFLSNHGIGDKVDLETLATAIATTNQKIVGMGYLQPGKFEEVYLHRSSPDGVGTRKVLFTGNVVEPLYNERAMLETSGRFRGVQFL
jgi:uncharacterized phage protein gp47/JayE